MEGGNKNPFKKGLWTEEEDRVLLEYIAVHGKGHWNRVAKASSLTRSGKSCRLRWLNYLSPAVNRGGFSKEEDDLIIRLHKLLGNRWSLIAGRVPGRTDNQVKNHWNTHLRKHIVRVEKRGIKSSSTSLDPKPPLDTINLPQVQEATTTNVDTAYEEDEEAQWMINILSSECMDGLLDGYLLDPL